MSPYEQKIVVPAHEDADTDERAAHREVRSLVHSWPRRVVLSPVVWLADGWWVISPSLNGWGCASFAMLTTELAPARVRRGPPATR
jgi:hypothetical protein